MASLSLTFDSGEEVRQLEFARRPLGFACRPAAGGFIIRSVVPGGLAERLGVRVGWKLVAIHGMDVESWSSERFDTKMKEHVEELDAATSSGRGGDSSVADDQTPAGRARLPSTTFLRAAAADEYDAREAPRTLGASRSQALISRVLDAPDLVEELELLRPVAQLEVGFRDETGNDMAVRFTQRPLGLVCRRQESGLVVVNVLAGGHAEELGVQLGSRVVSVHGSSVEYWPNDAVDHMLQEFLEELDRCQSTVAAKRSDSTHTGATGATCAREFALSTGSGFTTTTTAS